MICFDEVIAVLLSEMGGSGHKLVESLGKELAGGRQVPLFRHQYIEDLAILVDRRDN
jgi:hypothetical protein